MVWCRLLQTVSSLVVVEETGWPVVVAVLLVLLDHWVGCAAVVGRRGDTLRRLFLRCFIIRLFLPVW